MLSMEVALLNKASELVGTENSEKLWKRLLPAVVPPSMVKLLPLGVTMELLGRVASGTI